MSQFKTMKVVNESKWFDRFLEAFHIVQIYIDANFKHLFSNLSP